MIDSRSAPAANAFMAALLIVLIVASTAMLGFVGYMLIGWWVAVVAAGFVILWSLCYAWFAGWF